MKKKKFLFVILSIFVLFLSGCSRSEQNVKLLSQEQAIKYVQKNYGKGTYVNTQKLSDTEVKYTFNDDQYNFEYTLTSTVEKVSFPFDFYHSREFSDFEDNYYNYILNNLGETISKIENEENVKIVKREKAYQKDLFDIYNDQDNLELMEEASDELIKSIKKIDDRNFFKGYKIFIYSTLKEDDMGDKTVIERKTM